MTPPLRFVSYNVHGFADRRGHYLPQQTLSVLQQMQADVIALQEVLGDDRNGVDLLHQFSADLGYHLILGPTIQQSQRHHYGNALLLAAPPSHCSLHDISQPGREQRGVIECEVVLQQEHWRIFTTHLGLEPAERRKQTRQLLDLIQLKDHTHAALMGDINEWFNWGRPLRWLHGYFTKTSHQATFPARLPLLALDRIWIHSSRHTTKTYTCKSRLCRTASDHLPLVAEIHPIN